MIYKRWIKAAGAILLMLLAGAVLLNLTGGGMLWRTATNAVASRSLSCDQLPATIEAEAFMTDHKSFLDRIEAVNPGGVFVHVTAEEACPGRAILTIAYATESDRKTIEAILRDSPGNSRPVLWHFPRLFGIPYRLVNT